MSDSDKQSISPLELTFKDTEQLSRYVDENGKILSAKVNHLHAKAQRHVSRTIKRARNMLLMR